jgi:hypothetical protein
MHSFHFAFKNLPPTSDGKGNSCSRLESEMASDAIYFTSQALALAQAPSARFLRVAVPVLFPNNEEKICEALLEAYGCGQLQLQFHRSLGGSLRPYFHEVK